MEIEGAKTGPDGKVQCQFCHKWVSGRDLVGVGDLKVQTLEELRDSACPYCGDTGAEFRQRQCEVKRAFEDWQARNQS